MTAVLPDPMLTVPWQITRVSHDTDDTFTLELIPESSEHCPTPFAPGQFNMLYIFGVGEVPISISGDPAIPDLLTHTTREVGTVTRAMKRLHVGDSIGVRGPYGTAWPLEKAKGKDVVFVAGGIGLAPLRPAILQVVAQREAYQRVVILYGARTPEDLLFTEDLEAWGGRFDVEVIVSVDRAVAPWKGNVGVIPPLIKRIPVERSNAVAMICGPEIMMRYSVIELQRRGLDTDHIYVSMERNMKCAIGLCGHCQYGASFVCKDGPVFPFSALESRFHTPEI